MSPSLAAEPWIAKAFATAFFFCSDSGIAGFDRLRLASSAVLYATRLLPTPLSSSSCSPPSLPAFRYLITMLCRCGLHSHALHMFDEMFAAHSHSPDPAFITSLLTLLTDGDHLDASVHLLNRSRMLNCRLELHVFDKVLNALVEKNRVLDAVELFEQHLQTNSFVPDVWSFNVVLKGLCRGEYVDSMFMLMGRMTRFGAVPDIVSFNVLIDGLCMTNRIEEARVVLTRIKAEKICMPNVVTFTSVMSRYCKMGRMNEALQIYNEMICCGITPSRVTYNALIDGHGKVGDMVSASSTYEKMVLSGCHPDVVTFSSLIDGHFRNGQMYDAMKLWDDMGRKGVQPNAYTYSIMISSLCKINQIEEAHAILMELNDRQDIVPRAFNYNPVIDGLCKAGNLDKANHLFANMERNACFPDKYTYTILIIGHCVKGRMLDAIALFEKMLASRCYPDNVLVHCLVTCLLKAGMPSAVTRVLHTKSIHTSSFHMIASNIFHVTMEKVSEISVAV